MSINEFGKEKGNPGKDMTGAQGEKAEGAKSGAAPKKKLVAVYRPQNSQQIKSRPAGQKPKAALGQESRPAQAAKPGTPKNQAASLKALTPVEKAPEKPQTGEAKPVSAITPNSKAEVKPTEKPVEKSQEIPKSGAVSQESATGGKDAGDRKSVV